MRWRVLLVCGLLVLAGCSSAQPDATTTTTQTTTETATQITTETTETSTPTTSTAVTPFGDETITVGVTNYANQSRNVTALVADSLDYWNAHANDYGEYPATYVLAPNASNPDIEVRFVEFIAECGANTSTEDTLGCADVIERGMTVEETSVVRIRAGYTDESTVETLIHEFGHTRGIGHGEPPEAYMAAAGNATHLPVTDAVNQTYPWREQNLTVFLDVEDDGHSEREEDEIREQVGHALAYYEDGANGWRDRTPNFSMTANESSADIVIRVRAESGTLAGERVEDSSLGTNWGKSVDADDHLEYYTNATVVVAGIDEDHVGWHVGYWLAVSFGASDDDWPEHFPDADSTERASDWWER